MQGSRIHPGRGRRSLSLMVALTLAVPIVVATGGVAAAQDDAKFCEGTNIVFFPGGTEGGGFETVVYNGAKAAEAAFGPTVAYQWSDWNPQTMITQFSEAVATQPDGIAVMGHPGDDAFKPLIDDAVGQGIIVTVMNTELPETEAAHAAQGTGYVGAVLHDAGAALAKEAVARGGLQPGDKVFVWGLLSQAGRGERTQGIIDGLVESLDLFLDNRADFFGFDLHCVSLPTLPALLAHEQCFHAVQPVPQGTVVHGAADLDLQPGQQGGIRLYRKFDLALKRRAKPCLELFMSRRVQLSGRHDFNRLCPFGLIDHDAEGFGDVREKDYPVGLDQLTQEILAHRRATGSSAEFRQHPDFVIKRKGRGGHDMLKVRGLLESLSERRQRGARLREARLVQEFKQSFCVAAGYRCLLHRLSRCIETADLSLQEFCVRWARQKRRSVAFRSADCQEEGVETKEDLDGNS